MKKHFFEYYDILSDDDIKNIFQTCLFVFDTNVILNLYRYTSETRDEMLSIMEKYKDRIWMPYQVGWEYFNNRETVINNIANGCNALAKHIKDTKNSFFKVLDENYKRHPYIDKEQIKTLVEDNLKSVTDRLDELKRKDPHYSDNDVIWIKLTSLFDGHIGDDYDSNTLNEIYKEGALRYQHSIPPGYADLKEKKDMAPRHLYGDLIVWKQTIDVAKQKKVDVVFISDDQKEDWYEKTGTGETKRPRRELIKEFGVLTEGKNILLYNQDGFFYKIKKYLGDEVERNTIDEINEVAKQEAEKREERRKRNEELWKHSSYIDFMPKSGFLFDPSFSAKPDTIPLNEYFDSSTFPYINIQSSRVFPNTRLSYLSKKPFAFDPLGMYTYNSQEIRSALDELEKINPSAAKQLRIILENNDLLGDGFSLGTNDTKG